MIPQGAAGSLEPGAGGQELGATRDESALRRFRALALTYAASSYRSRHGESALSRPAGLAAVHGPGTHGLRGDGRLPNKEAFGLTSQIRRAAVSIPSNIAEGRGRTSEKSFALFLTQARGSLYELGTQAELAGELGFATKDQAAIIAEAAEISRMIHGLLAKLLRGA
jgi:four helix bundle protein